MILYSVIIPAYNADGTIGKCLESLMNQSVPKEAYEIIVLDDGSTDSTAEKAKKFSVRYFFQTNQGPATARNAGAKEAKGEIILFTDSDCIPGKNWIEKMAVPFNNPEVMAVKGAYKTEQKTLTARFAQIEFEERFNMLKKTESIDMVDTYSAGYRKSVFISLGGFDPSFPVANNEDTELSYKMSRSGYKMVFNPDAIVYHLNHPDSVKRYARLKFWRGYWRMVVYKRYPDKMLKDSYTPQSLKLQILFLFLFLTCLPLTWLLPNLMFYPVILCLILFILSTLPFIRLALTRDLIVALLSPFFLSVRAVSLGTGTFWAILSQKNLK
ncbi:MAG: glycosyltransferase [Nitrospirae bacterium]|nr:glycosyltransferase [Nitrospirota bacterium]